MNDNKQLQQWSIMDCDAVNFDDLEQKLESDLEDQMQDLSGLEKDFEKIGSPEALGETVMNVVWEQFVNQIGVVAGEDFIKENRGLKLDLRDSAHIQTTENFAKGKIATHNTNIDYQKRYDDWQSNFQHNEDGSVITHTTRTGEQEANLVGKSARKLFDAERPIGSTERGTDMDHTVSAGEIIRDPVANAHLTKGEQISFANSEANLNEINASHNRSKKDLPMNDWLDTPNANGQTPREIFDDMNPELEEQYRQKDKESREAYEKKKAEGEKRSEETGKQSQKAEAFRIGGKALRSVLLGLLASLIKDIICKLIAWFRAGNRKLDTFIDSVKNAIMSFIFNIKEHLFNAGNTLITTIATAILRPIIGMIKKAWIFLKQGYKSVKEAIKFLKDPANRNMPFNVKMLEVGKIIVVGLTAGGAIILSEVIEKGLMTIPGFAFEIPLLGSLANLLGMFLGTLVSGLIGALALNLIDRVVANKLKKLNLQQQIDRKNQIITIQGNLTKVVADKFGETRKQISNNIQGRHIQALEEMRSSIQNIVNNSEGENQSLYEDAEIVEDDLMNEESENTNSLNKLFSDLEDLKTK